MSSGQKRAYEDAEEEITSARLKHLRAMGTQDILNKLEVMERRLRYLFELDPPLPRAGHHLIDGLREDIRKFFP